MNRGLLPFAWLCAGSAWLRLRLIPRPSPWRPLHHHHRDPLQRPRPRSTLPGLAGRLRQTSYDTAAVGQTFYGMMSTYDEETLTSVYTIIATDTAANTQQKAAELETQGYYTSLAAWQDGLELYIDDWLDETGQPVTNSYQNGDITSWRYKIDPATGQMERLEVEGAPYSPQWQDDAAVDAERSGGPVDRMYQPAGSRHRPAGGPASAVPDAERI